MTEVGEAMEAEQRDFFRYDLVLSGSCSLGESTFACETTDLSYSGARVKTVAPGRIGADTVLSLAGIGQLKGKIIRITRDGFALEFGPDNEPDMITALNLRLVGAASQN